MFGLIYSSPLSVSLYTRPVDSFTLYTIDKYEIVIVEM